ncbi:B12-binding domain-containing radical SAM protein [Paraliomyxa miuraensis]|uniref:B12-binding domain-containing radical SAM protein n=1 Tax=Paraliomyxa miuraensis TaxID=376150 RepID=UPI002255BFAE|nr:cobalamin-dependent protein [Paraliomyxa miuraensis]MCX4241423.1 cobalamin-dependent protein [Paraliomyxa miuraensis]
MSEPVALAQLAAMVPDHEVRILDMRLEEDVELNRVLLEFQPDLVGTTSMTTDCYQAKAVLEAAKGTLGPGCFTIVGGHHPTLSPADFEADCVDAIALGEGEETFEELVAHLAAGKPFDALHAIDGLRFRDATNAWVTTEKRKQNRDLDSFPPPARHLVRRRPGDYFFMTAGPMASISTSRGCSFDCNFCAIWEFYERKTRFLSAEAICDRLEQIEERVVFFLDDNFLTNRTRLGQLCDEIERRGIKKYYATQGRTDFIADNPELMKRLRDAGLIMVLSGYESNEEHGLEYLLKRTTVEKNRRAAEIMQELGIISTGIFMVRQDFSEEDFDRLYAHINELGVAIPLVSILTPLPGTQLYRERYEELLTTDARFFDLLHSVLPTKLPRERFYEKFAAQRDSVWASVRKGALPAVRKRPAFFLHTFGGALRWLKKRSAYFSIVRDPGSHLRDELGTIPVGITVENAPLRARPGPAAPVPLSASPSLVQLRVARAEGPAQHVLSVSEAVTAADPVVVIPSASSPRSKRQVHDAPFHDDPREFLARLRAFVRSHPAVNHPLLTRLVHVPFTREDHKILGLQHHAVVGLHTRCLEQLLPRACGSEARVWILEALLHEHEGAGREVHVARHREYLLAAGASDAEALDTPLHAHVTAFVRAQLELCTNEPFLVGLGAVGPGHEWSVPPMFSFVVRGLSRVGFTSDELDYFHRCVRRPERQEAWLEHALVCCADGHEAQAQIYEGTAAALDAWARLWTGVQRKMVRWRQPANLHVRSQSAHGRYDEGKELTLRQFSRELVPRRMLPTA